MAITEQVRQLGLSASQEQVLASLVFTVLAADQAQRAALSFLPEEQRRLLAFEKAALADWFAAEPNRTLADLDLELERIVNRIDPQQTFEAAALLAVAVAEARPVLAGTPAPKAVLASDGWIASRELLSGLGAVPPRAIDPSLDLQTALARLASVLGVPPPTAPTLPADVDRALAQIVAAYAAGAQTEPAWQAQWVLDAVHSALPTFQGMAASWPAGPVGPSTAASSSQGGCVVPQGAPDPQSPPSAPPFTTTPPPLPEPPAAIDPTGPTIVVAIPAVGPDCAPNPLLLVVAGPGADLHTEPAIIRIDLGGDDEYVGEVAGRAEVHSGAGTPRASVGSLNIDLDGDDQYSSPTRSETQGFASAGFSLLLDIAGNDTYEAGERSQGASCCAASASGPAGPGGIGLLLDLQGSDSYSASHQSQGYAATGLASVVSPSGAKRGVGGFLVDAAGNDVYRFATQGLATACPPGQSLADTAFDRVLAVLWDMQGDDQYISEKNPVNVQTSDVFSNQGRAICPDLGALPMQLVAGMFLDSGGSDQYTTLALPAKKPQDVSATMNGGERIATEPSGLTSVPKAVGIFRDMDESGTGVGPDTDRDGFGDAAEMLAGTDQQDPEDRPTDLQHEDPNEANRWVFVPRPLSATEGQDLMLPGLAILGPGDSALTEPVDVVIDLGGNDVYAAPHLGGILPYEQRPTSISGQTQPWYVSLVVDAGNGTDTYRPPAVLRTRLCKPAETPSPCSFDHTEPDRFHDNPVLAVGAALGGAVNGIAFLADHGGSNTFAAQANAEAESQEDTQTSGRQAVARAMGVAQGAGVNGGLGILATWDAENVFTTEVRATSIEVGGQDSRPYASALGIVQGAGWNGAGFLLAFGPGGQEAHSSVQASTDPPSVIRVQQLAVAQGAARGGIGILVDTHGNARYVADQPLAQGAGWTLDQRTDKPTPRIEGLGVLMASSIPASSAGLLLVGPGTHSFEAPGAAQGMALGLASIPDGEDGDAYLSQVHDRSRSIGVNSPGGNERLSTTNIRGLPALGILTSLAGSDNYVLGTESGGQGRGVAGGVGVLIDLAGDDLYDARSTLGVQGSAHLGQGVLLDLAGHDRYLALGQAQGFATDDPAVLAYVLGCVGNPGRATAGKADAICTTEPNVGANRLTDTDPNDPNAAYGTSQARVRLLGQFPTLGLLVDRQGSDSYNAVAQAQGAARATLQYAAEAGTCKSRNTQVGSGAPNTVTAFLIPCENPYYPGQDPAPPGYPTESPRPIPPTEMDTAPPPSNGFVLGLFVDGSLTDRYVNPVPGRQALAPTSLTDGNNWAWRNVVAPSSNLNQTRLTSPGELPNVPLEELNGYLDLASDLLQTVNGTMEPPTEEPPQEPEEDELDGVLDQLEALRDDVFPGVENVCNNFVRLVDQGLGDACLVAHDQALAASDLIISEARKADADASALEPAFEQLRTAIGILQKTIAAAQDVIAMLDETIDTALSNPDGARLPSADVPAQASVLGLGVDDATLDGAARVLMGEVEAAIGSLRVEIVVATDAQGTPLAPDAIARGALFLLATVHLPSSLQAIEGRLDFLQDHEFLAQAQEVARGEGTRQYLHEWDTAAQRDGAPVAPDGDRVIEASFFATEGSSIESVPVLVPVDNPPVLRIAWTSYSAGVLNETDRLWMSPSLGHEAQFDLTISPDLDSDGPQGGLRGADLRMTLEGPQSKTLFEGHLLAGTHSFVLDGACGQDRCPDGQYDLSVVATDGAGGEARMARAITFDGTAPTSAVDLPEFAGVVHRPKGGQGLEVRYSFEDENATVPGVGVAIVDLFRIHADGTTQRVGGGLSGLAVVKEGVATNATLRFVTVARDRLGNSESPCLTGSEAVPCVLAKIAAAAAGTIPAKQRPVNVTIDFSPPVITAAAASHQFVAPGVTPVSFRASVAEQGTGLTETFVRLPDSTGGETHYSLTRGADGIYEFPVWNQSNGGLPALEEPYFFTFVAVDRAGNAASIEGDGMLDALPPRMKVLPTQYRDATLVERSVGKPGSQAFITVEVTDAAIEVVTANVTALEEGRPDQDCQAAAGPFVCPIFLPLQIPDGTFEIPVTARDLAGNLNTTSASIVVSSERLGIENVTVEAGFDSVTLHWTTERPGTSQVFYGQTRTLDEATKTLRREAPLNASYSTDHVFRVTGLVPSTDYFFQAASQNEAGAQNLSAIIPARTLSALYLTFPGLVAEQVLSGNVTIVVQVSALGGTGDADEVSLMAKWRAANFTFEQQLGNAADVFGLVPLVVDTTLLADGTFNLTAEAVRKGDFTNATSPPVFIDNGPPLVAAIDPLPEGEIAAARPVITLVVADALGPRAIRPDTSVVTVDGKQVPAVVDNWTPAEQSRLRLRLPSLAPGLHNLTVTVHDWAGNFGETALQVLAVGGNATDFQVNFTYNPGPVAGRPGSAVNVQVTGAEGLALKSLRAQVSNWIPVPLEHDNGTWHGLLPIPSNETDGRYDVVLHGIDGWGMPVTRPGGTLAVDSQPPLAEFSAAVATPTTLRLAVSTNEPLSLRVKWGAVTLFESTEPAAALSPTLGPLPPGATHALVARVTDGAGNFADHFIEVAMPEDVSPPGIVTGLMVEHGAFGAPMLSWDEAPDNGVVAFYEVIRTSSAGPPARFQNVTNPFIDHGAPVAQALLYEVVAVDSATNRGDPARAIFERLAGPARLEASITPDRGTTTTEFEIEVLYSHESGQPPTVIVARIDGQEVKLKPLDERPECQVGCRYGAITTLPATSQFAKAPLVVETEWRGESMAIEVPQPPVVASPDEISQAGKDSPPSGFWAIAIAMLAAVLIARRLRP